MVDVHQLLNIVPTDTGFNVIGVVGRFPYKSSFFPQTLARKSLVLCLRVPPSEKRSGEQSRFSWTYYPKRVMTNEIVKSVIIMYHFPYNGKISSSAFKYLYLF